MSIEVVADLFAILSFVGFVMVSIRLYFLDVELNAMKKSTHKIQWMPIDQAWADSEKEINKAMESQFGHSSDYEGIN